MFKKLEQEKKSKKRGRKREMKNACIRWKSKREKMNYSRKKKNLKKKKREKENSLIIQLNGRLLCWLIRKKKRKKRISKNNIKPWLILKCL